MSDRVSVFQHVSERLRADDDMYLIKGTGLDIFLKRDFLSPDECDTLINMIDLDKRPSTVLGPSPDPNYRTSESSSLGNSNDEIIARIDCRIASLTGIEPRFGERIEGQRYAEGQQFKPHYDYFHPSERYWPDQNLAGGQRTWTVMVWLNQPEAGGGTLFPEAGVRIKPRAGNFLAWCNLDADGELNTMSLHCGEPVERGMKYILTKWHRERPFTPEAVPSRLRVTMQTAYQAVRGSADTAQ